MLRLSSLAAALAATRRSRLPWEAAYDAMVEGLKRNRAGAAAPRVGAPMPDFALPDAAGRWTRLDELLAPGPLILSFQRGGWCPYCRTEMAAWRAAAPALEAAGLRLAVVTPETGGRAAALADEVGERAILLCDVDHGVAMALGLTVPLPPEIARRYREGGLDLDRLTGGAGGFVPIPATFAIDAGGIVRFAHADPDFRLRAEPADVLAALGAGPTISPAPAPSRGPARS
jgi:peroxiredoxin